MPFSFRCSSSEERKRSICPRPPRPEKLWLVRLWRGRGIAHKGILARHTLAPNLIKQPLHRTVLFTCVDESPCSNHQELIYFPNHSSRHYLRGTPSSVFQKQATPF